MADERTLEEVKELISEKYLGQSGIHGIGLRRKNSAITVYVDPGATEEQSELLTQIGEEVKPFKLMIVEEGRSSIQ